MFESTVDVVLLPPTWLAYGVPFDTANYCPVSPSYGHGWSRMLILAALGCVPIFLNVFKLMDHQ